MNEEMKETNLKYLLGNFNNLDDEEEKEDYLAMLEFMIETANQSANDGQEFIPDSIYDVLIDYLKQLYPTSPLVTQNWTKDEEANFDERYDKFLNSNPMMSIQTIKSLSEKSYYDFIDRLGYSRTKFLFSTKLNGWGIRVVFENGSIVKATTRGRSTSGRDITDIVKNILDDMHIEEWENLGVVELRGECLLPLYNFEEAKEFNPDLKSAFTAVSSLIKPSSTPDENALLNIVFYDVIFDGSNIEFSTIKEKYEFLESVDLETPYYEEYDYTPSELKENLPTIIENLEEYLEDYVYFLDGIVLTVNSLTLFRQLGQQDKFNLGNIALKVGAWSQNGYSGVVKEIKWTNGKSKKTPVAVLEEPVMTASGSSVTNVPLYAPVYILMLEAYPGNIIYFNYGGEAGVVPTTPDGQPVKVLK